MKPLSQTEVRAIERALAPYEARIRESIRKGKYEDIGAVVSTALRDLFDQDLLESIEDYER